MKKNLLSAFALFAFATMAAQTTIYTGNGALSSARTVTLGGYNLTFKPSNTPASFFINGTTGFTGINTTAPTEVLDVNGNIQGKIGIFTNSSTATSFTSANDRNIKSKVFNAGTLVNPTTGTRLFNIYDFPLTSYNPEGATIFLDIEDRSYKSRLHFWAAQNNGGQFNLYDKTQAANLSLTDDGNNNISLTLPKANSYLSIGTTSFTDGTDLYKLSVNGNIRAHRVKVYTTWADYVFEDTYELPTLNEVEAYINENGHLKDIPSAAEVEAKGIELGEMNKLLLQKIEELTLYTIELNRQVQELKSKINN